MWHKREAEWKREKVARERLMQEVFQVIPCVFGVLTVDVKNHVCSAGT